MFQSKPGPECQHIKAIIFTYKSTERMRDNYIREEQFELAAEAQQQLRELKQSLFEVLLSDRYVIEQRKDHSITIRSNK